MRAHLSAHALQLLDYAAVGKRRTSAVGEALWLAVRGNLAVLAMPPRGPLSGDPAAKKDAFTSRHLHGKNASDRLAICR